jgi:PAS domain S-box-containing protein
MVQPKRKKTTSKKKSGVIAYGEPVNTQPHSIPGSNADADQHGLALLNEVEDYAMIMLDPKGNIMSWNRGAQKIKGYATDEMIGKNYRIFYTSEDRKNNLSETLLERARTEGRTTYEGWRVKKDGSRFWGSMALTALHDKDGNVTGFFKLTRDLTEKKIAEDTYSNFVEELKIKNEALQESEQKYHKMVSEVRDYAIILLDVDGKILDWNKGAEALKGYSAKEIIGKNFRLFYPKEDKDGKLPERLLGEAKSKGSVIHEGWRIRKDGKRFWGNVAITALHDDEHNVIGYTKVTRDLTDRKIGEDRLDNLVEELRQSNERLKESEERYHRMIAEVQDYAIIRLDEKGNIENWNAGAQAIKGYAAPEIIGKSFKIFYSKEDRTSGLPERLLRQARSSGRVSHEGWRLRKDGSKFWGNVVITALHSDSGEVVGFSKVTRDLTEKKLADDVLKSNAAQLDLKNKALERLNEELNSFTNVASHDLKEPLRKVLTFANRIKDVKNDPEQTEEFANKIIEGAGRMRRLIEDLLSYSQVSNEPIRREDVNLNQVVDSVKNDLEIQIAEKKATIKVGKLPIIRAVPHQMHQLFLNLISNGIKFSRDEVSPSISVQCRIINGPDIPGELPNGDNQYYEISVRDNGIGFKLDEGNRIFDAFFRIHPQGKFRGTGLGLAIVKKIVENHNGIITADSEPDRGSVFHIYIPKNTK